MVATLHHNPIPRTSNFYENSFKQLSDIQQKQTGLIIGAAVADAAARALDGLTAEEISAYAADFPADIKHGEEESIVFAQLTESSPHNRRFSGPLRHHSYTCLLMLQLLGVMASSRGEFSVRYVKNDWVSAARAHPSCFAAEHASLLHVLGVLLPLPVIYPWADDTTLREYAAQFVDFLTEPPEEEEEVNLSETRITTRKGVEAYTFSSLGVALRCLQSNPNPYRNAAFMAVPGTADVFPDDIAQLSSSHAKEKIPLLSVSASANHSLPAIAADTMARMQIKNNTTPINISDHCRSHIHSTPRFPLRPLTQDVSVVRESFIVAKKARSFSDGVKAAIRLGGPVSQRSLIVGALLGAQFGVRRIPTAWLSATHNYGPLVTMAMEVAQWSWNPPHH
ncbi:uncharacterized protein TM35_000241550 [Trypanosoma theileri]|uniref:ADP-ribosylglycohydrolase n=1 Tax=Trypanosoma theileri TaxID=67003 RepID=A0A1X0NQK8_9TRYP|nr:uncharacterized protein TM35_000241550 [Trypanosoma theileri]ORC87005.1 hypothetical protein TM35_000241550 [Trypanosoma theileri]